MNNPTLIQYFEWYLPEDGTHWRRCAAQAEKLASLGINMAWLPPAYKGNGGSKDVGYAVYDTYDLGEFDQKGSIATKYGTKADYLHCIQIMQEKAIRVLGDIVLNHRIGADDCETIKATEIEAHNRYKSRSSEASKDVTVWTRFNFDGRNGIYSDFKWNWRHFDGTDWDDQTKRNMLLRFYGKTWDDDVDPENGNYDYLMGADLDMSHPEVLKELDTWGKWYLDMTGINGMRLDAVKHIDADFFKNWLNDMRSYKKDNFFAVGEYWSSNLEHLLTYLDAANHSMSLFDVPLHFHFYEASYANGQYDLSSLYKNTLVDKDAWHAVTFVDNHDTQPGQALQSYVNAWFKPLAYSLILLNQHGLPCVFYGDFYGIPHDSLMPVAELPKLIYLRKVAAYGPQHDYFDHPHIVGFTREGDLEHPNSGLAMLISDMADGDKRMYIGKHFANKTLYNLFAKTLQTVTIDSNGYGTFQVPGGYMSVWATKEIYEEIQIHI